MTFLPSLYLPQVDYLLVPYHCFPLLTTEWPNVPCFPAHFCVLALTNISSVAISANVAVFARTAEEKSFGAGKATAPIMPERLFYAPSGHLTHLRQLSPQRCFIYFYFRFAAFSASFQLFTFLPLASLPLQLTKVTDN